MNYWDKQFKDFVKKKCKGILTISQMLQSEMAGEAEQVGITFDHDVMVLIKEARSEGESI